MIEEKKNIVSLEDRIPKLKQARKRRANIRLIFYLTILFFLVAIVVYLQSPLSHVRDVSIVGNTHVSDQKLIDMSHVTKEDNFWKVDKDAVAELVNVHPEIAAASVDRKLPGTIEINVDEYERVGYVKVDGSYYPILENGERLDSYQLKSPSGDAPLLIDFNKPTYLEGMSKELQQLPGSIASMISEIYWEPTDENPYQIRLYMTDGYEVLGTIRNFSEKILAYPSIVSQLGPDDRGIIHIDVGAYFEAYPGTEAPEDEANEEESTDEGQG
ncbi:cell division protein FtsQ/DivIB [Thalassobacillus hwangdonensis]|uniref:Cell division protein DivIB n=1 Tax=Thalassobacillus hwangdonensis TaxID=546108 RepID=A0ABW3L0H6_9BACI